MIRQGDVLLLPTTKKPSAKAETVTDQGRVILAYGEVTGHCHEVLPATDNRDDVPPMQLFQEPDGTRILVLKAPCALKHEEHDRLDLPAGGYIVRRQVEWSLEQARQVAD